MRPQLLVLDEPTSALDVIIQQQVLSLLHSCKERCPACSLPMMWQWCCHAMARVIVMKDGEVVESGGVQRVLVRRSTLRSAWWSGARAVTQLRPASLPALCGGFKDNKGRERQCRL